jgi:hypothetical protein
LVTVQTHASEFLAGRAILLSMTNLSNEISARYGFSEVDIQPLEDGNQKLFDIDRADNTSVPFFGAILNGLIAKTWQRRQRG